MFPMSYLRQSPWVDEWLNSKLLVLREIPGRQLHTASSWRQQIRLCTTHCVQVQKIILRKQLGSKGTL